MAKNRVGKRRGRQTGQKNIPEDQFKELYNEAKSKFNDLVKEDENLSRAKAVNEAIKTIFRNTLSKSGVNSRAKSLWKKGVFSEDDVWHIARARNDKHREANACIEAGRKLITYSRDSNAGHGVYYAVLLGIPDKTHDEIIYIGSADVTFGSRQLMPDKYGAYSSRVPHGNDYTIETRCLIGAVASYEMLGLESWVTRCWSLLVKRLPALHKIDRNAGKAIPLEDLKRLDLERLEKALLHLDGVGKDHEVGLWKKSGHGNLDLSTRIELLIKSLKAMRNALIHKQPLRLVGGNQGRSVYIKEGTGFKMKFNLQSPSTQWVTGVAFTRKTLADTAAGNGLLSLGK